MQYLYGRTHRVFEKRNGGKIIVRYFLDMYDIVISGPWAALAGGTVTWLITVLGALLVVFFNKVNKRAMALMCGVSAGIMMSASFWSLLLPAKERAEEMGSNALLPLTLGFMAGGLFIILATKFLEVMQNKNILKKKSSNRGLLIMIAVTLHNIPEGLAIGVAFGAANDPVSTAAALALTIGIGLQNFPEGAAVALPVRRDGASRVKSFLYGAFSAIVEPLAAVVGAMLVHVTSILPYALAFSAGAMIFVTVKELIPEAAEDKKFGALSIMLGFTAMTLLDVALG